MWVPHCRRRHSSVGTLPTRLCRLIAADDMMSRRYVGTVKKKSTPEVVFVVVRNILFGKGDMIYTTRISGTGDVDNPDDKKSSVYYTKRQKIRLIEPNER